MIQKVIILITSLIILSFSAQSVYASNTAKDVFVVFDTESSGELRRVSEAAVLDVDGYILQLFPEKVALLRVSEKQINVLRDTDHVRVVFEGHIDNNSARLYGDDVVAAAHVWNGLEKAQKPQPEKSLMNKKKPGMPKMKPEKIDGFWREQRGGKAAPFGAGYYDTSEFMHGSISVAVILTESSGSLQVSTEDWTPTQEINVQSEVTNGMNWWVSRYVEHNNTTPISFTTHFYNGRTDARAQTKYEPINNSGGDDVTKWGPEIMEKFGYTNNQGGSNKYFYRAADFINDMRTADGTDWGVVIFVADDSNDANNAFTDGSFAYSWLGGPSIQMTYDNDGWGIGVMDMVMAHELGHSFYALDEYSGAPTSCTEKAGYNYIQNQNYQGGCALNEDSLMRSTSLSFTNGLIDVYARGQVGWWDSDGDKIADILDIDPTIAVTSLSTDVNNNVTVSGSASVGQFANQNAYLDSQTIHGFLGFDKNNSSTDTLASVQYRIDGGALVHSFKSNFSSSASPTQSFVFQTGSLSSGAHTLEIFATSSQTGKVGSFSQPLLLNAPEPPGGARVLLGDSKLNVIWDNPSSYTKIKVLRKTGSYSSDSTDGDIIFSGDATSFMDTGLQNGTKYLYTVYACGSLGECSEGVQASGTPNARLIVTGAGKDRAPIVRTFGYLGDKKSEFLAYAENVTSGVEVAVGDVNGDGVDEIITGSGEGGGPQVRIFDRNGSPQFTNGFFAYSSLFRGGVHVGVADVDGDGKDEILTGAGIGGGPHVRVFDEFGKPQYAPRLFPYAETFKGGVYVSGGDLDGDGIDEIITGSGNGGGPQIRVFNKEGNPKITNGFFAYGKNFRGGVLVSAADLNNDGKDEIIAGPGYTGGPQVRTFSGNGEQIFTPGFFAYDDQFRGGVFVTAHDLNADGKAEIITGTGYSGGPHIRIFTRYGVPYLTPGFFAEDKNARSGTYISAGNF